MRGGPCDTCSYSLVHPHTLKLASNVIIPLELCEVPPGQLARKEMSSVQIRNILEFSGLAPCDRAERIRSGLDDVCYHWGVGLTC